VVGVPPTSDDNTGHGERGTASVELVAAVPFLLLALAVAAQIALAGQALWSASVAARAGARVVATDVLDAAVRCARANAVVNGVADRVEVLLGDGFAPVRGRVFDLICTSPPQMPTPPDRERADATAAADNGGPDGWALLDRVIAGAPAHLAPGGRLVFTLFGFLGVKAALARLHHVGFEPTILGQETQAFPRIGYERIEHIRALDAEATLPPHGWPATVERYVIQGAWQGTGQGTRTEDPAR